MAKFIVPVEIELDNDADNPNPTLPTMKDAREMVNKMLEYGWEELNGRDPGDWWPDVEIEKVNVEGMK